MADNYVDIVCKWIRPFGPPFQLIPSDFLYCRLCENLVLGEFPDNAPDLDNVIATTNLLHPLSTTVLGGLRFTFDTEPTLTPGTMYWVTHERTEPYDPKVFYDHYRIAYEIFTDLPLQVDLGTDYGPTDWGQVTLGGYAGTLVLGNQTIYDRPWLGESGTQSTLDWGANETHPNFTATNFIALEPPPEGTGVYLMTTEMN